jgi:hypothetical protein
VAQALACEVRDYEMEFPAAIWRKSICWGLERCQTRFPDFPHLGYGEPLSGSSILPHQTRKKLIFRELEKK